jgi:ATP-dependent RNA helicase DeaD
VRDTGPPAVDQVFHEVRHHAKSAALGRLIDFHDPRSGLVFCNTQRMVDELADWLLDRGCAAERLHGGMAQPQRTRVMEGFKRGAFRWLVATDVAARGIDVHDLALVVNYDLPIDAEDYVHRIGRTGRAGRNGMAVTLVSGGAGYRLGQIERALGVRIRREPVPSLKDVAAKRAAVVVDRVREALLAPGGPPPSGVVNALVEEGHALEAIAAALVACYAPVPPADMPEEPLDAMPHRGPPGGPFGKVSGGKRPFAKRPYGKRPATGAVSPPRAVATEHAADQAGPRHPKKTARTFGPVAGGGAEGGSRPPWAKKSFAKKKVWKKKKPGPG